MMIMMMTMMIMMVMTIMTIMKEFIIITIKIVLKINFDLIIKLALLK